MAESGLKRPHPESDDAGNKRSRSNNGSPVPTGAKLDISAQVAAARARAEELKKKLAKPAASSSTSVPVNAPPPNNAGAAGDRVAQLKARIAAAANRATELAGSTNRSSLPTRPSYDNEPERARGGLNVGLHPSLQADAQPQDSRQSRPGHYKNGANQSQKDMKKAQFDLSGPNLEELKQNQYYDNTISVANASGRERKRREIVFNQPGKYVAQAAALRRQAQVEAMKKRIASRARQAGVDEDIDAEKAFLVPAPPEVEWWDENLIQGSSYANVDINDPSTTKIDSDDSIITLYVQHPVLIEPPQEKIAPAAKPMYLTTKEQRKIRRQRRMADLKEKQAKIRLGLEPPPPPKVKKSNLMRVLGDEAIQDPTAVEARVNREIQERHDVHEAMNEERKLTKEERHEKLERQQNDDLAKGVHVRVYRVGNLANGKHRYQIGINAEQNGLHGVCVMHPKFNVIVVEGGEHSIRNYDKLMLKRIKWQENEEPRATREGNKEVLAQWLDAYEDESEGKLKDLSGNSCEMIFSGEQKRRGFRKWFGAKVCETEQMAKDALARGRMDSMWAVAKSFQKDEYS